MWLKLHESNVVGNMLPGSWRVALVRPELLLRVDIGPETEQAAYAPLEQVRCLYRRGGTGHQEEARAVRVESVSQRTELLLLFDFYLPEENAYLTVELLWQPDREGTLKTQ